MYPFAAATQGAESSQKLTHLLNAVTDALVWVIAKSGISSQQQSIRLANLLMLLSHVRHASNKGMEHLLSMKCKNVVPVYDLLLEMLNAHTLRGYKPSGAGSECSPAQESRGREGFQKSQSQWCPALRWTGHRGSQRLKRELQHELWAPLRVGGRHYCVPAVGTLVWYGWLCHIPSVPQPPHFPGVWECQFSLLTGGTLECSICLHWVWPHRISVWSPSYFPSSYHPFGKHLKGFGTNGENLTWEYCEVEREEENADIYGEWDSLYPNLPLEWMSFVMLSSGPLDCTIKNHNDNQQTNLTYLPHSLVRTVTYCYYSVKGWRDCDLGSQWSSWDASHVLPPPSDSAAICTQVQFTEPRNCLCVCTHVCDNFHGRWWRFQSPCPWNWPSLKLSPWGLVCARERPSWLGHPEETGTCQAVCARHELLWKGEWLYTYQCGRFRAKL